MPNKFMPHGIVGQAFTHDTIDNAAQGDLVEITGTMTVDTAATGRAIGRIVTIDKHTGLVVVELFAAQIFEVKVGATAVVAGDFVKTSAANTVIPGDDGDGLTFAIALEGGATGASITVVPA